MTTADIDDPRRAYNPLFNDNKLKLGTFGTNVSHGCAITTIDGVFETTWPNTLKLAQMCDDAGFESIIPVARWRGFGGETNFNGGSFETYTWAAGLGATTSRAAVLATSHVPTVHPLVAAKQVSTIDHITQGRFALNIVCGWFEPELQMFGAPLMDHEARYEYAEEWLAIMKRLWTEEDEFDFDGKYFNIKKGFHHTDLVRALRGRPGALDRRGDALDGAKPGCGSRWMLAPGRDKSKNRNSGRTSWRYPNTASAPFHPAT